MGKGDRRRQQKERPMGIPDLDVKTPDSPTDRQCATAQHQEVSHG